MRKGRDGGKREKNGGKKGEKTDENSGHYVIASSRPPERRPLERRTLAPKRARANSLAVSLVCTRCYLYPSLDIKIKIIFQSVKGAIALCHLL